MIDQLFDTPEKVELAIANFIDVQKHPGWILVKQIVDANIQILSKQILAGGDKVLMDDKRRDLLAYENVINTPADQIKKLRSVESPAPNHDPYDQPKPVEPEEAT